jgi:hypothetical protein
MLVDAACREGSYHRLVRQDARRDRCLDRPRGPNPPARGKRGSTYHVLVDCRGVPPAVRLSAANVHACKLPGPLVDAVPPIRRPIGQPGRPRFRPAKLHGDEAHAVACFRQAPRRRGITSRLARRGIGSSERSGRYRFLHRACALTRLRYLQQVGQD